MLQSTLKSHIAIKIGFYLMLLTLAGYTLYSIYGATRQIKWDFPNYYVSSRLLLEGEHPSRFYNNTWFETKAHEIGIETPSRFRPFPPITSLIMLPLAKLQPLPAKQIWVLFNVLVLVFVIYLVGKICQFDRTLSAFLVLLSGASLAINFHLGQLYLSLIHI